jgi:hypothetical protein
MARPRYTAAKRAREERQKAKREAKLAKKHARTRSSASEGATPESPPGPASDQAVPNQEKPSPTQ